MGIADEIMDLVKQYGRCCWRAGAFEDVQRRCDESGRGDLLGVSLRSRLTALETELEGYRKGKALDALTVEAQANGEYGLVRLTPADNPRIPPGMEMWVTQGVLNDVAEQIKHPSGLPCSSAFLNAQSDITGEELD